MDFGTTICPALWLKAAQLAEYVEQSYPIGMLMLFEGDQSNLPAQPDSNYWQFLDGSVVTNVNSPLHGVTLPDFRGRFFRHPTGSESPGDIGGADSISLAHAHDGFVNYATDWDSLHLDRGIDRGQAHGNHTHIVSSDLGSVSTVPARHEVQCYIRIA